jgi:hypothetical protein
MGLDTFIPSLWAGQLLSPLYKQLVYGSVVNRDYEGEIRQFGDSVRINEIGDITVADYTKYGNLSWQELSSAQKTLFIDQAKTFSFAIDDIDMAQSKPKVMGEAMSRAAYAIADVIDQRLASHYADAGNVLTAGTVVSSGSALTLVARFAEALNKRNVPTAGRFLIVPPEFVTKLVLGVSGGVSTDAVPKETSPGQIANGFVGSVYGFSILMSNNVAKVGQAFYPFALVRSAISYAGQLTSIKAVEREDRFDQGVKGLYVYGSKVVRPDALATMALTIE